jgi:glycosyltransferase involved in cell wall biosynthesis
MRQAILSNATQLFACSKSAAIKLYGNFDSNVEIIPNAIDISAYENFPKNARKLLRKELNFPKKGPLIGHIGRFDKVKNHDFLIKIFARYHKQNPHSNLVLVGEGPLENKTKNLVNRNDLDENVHFLGVRSDIPKILMCLDLLLLPSISEGLGIVLVEAQAAGIPCIASTAVPKEADLGLGLVKFLNLCADTWSSSVDSALTDSNIPWNARKHKLELHGYNILNVAKKLEQIYTNI